MQENNNLGGLKIVFIGFIIQIAGQICSGNSIKHTIKGMANISSAWNSTSAATSAISIIASLTAFIGLILIIVGLSKVKMVSPYFKKSRNLYIANILVGIALIVVIAIMAGSTAALLTSAAITGSAQGTNAAMAGTFVVAVMIAVAMAVISILAIRALMLGCSDVAQYHKDDVLSHKCQKTWKMYLLAQILMVIAVIILIIASVSSIMSIYSSYNSGSSLSYTGIAGGLIGAVILIFAAAVFEFVVQILVLIRIWNTYSKFNGKWPGQTLTEASSDADHAQSEWEHVEPEAAALPEEIKSEAEKHEE